MKWPFCILHTYSSELTILGLGKLKERTLDFPIPKKIGECILSFSELVPYPFAKNAKKYMYIQLKSRFFVNDLIIL